MKKIFTLLALAICSLSAMATDYTGTLSASLLDQTLYSDTKTATLNVDPNATDGSYLLTIPSLDVNLTDVGDVTIPDLNILGLVGTDNGTTTTYTTSSIISVPLSVLGLADVDLNIDKVTVDNATHTLTVETNLDLKLLTLIPIGVLDINFTGVAPAPTVVNTTTYPGDLTVTIGTGDPFTIPGSSAILTEYSDGTYTITIPDTEIGGGITLPEIAIPGITGTTDGTMTTLGGATTQVDLGPLGLGIVDVTLNSGATADGTDLNLSANVDALGGINVKFGPATTDGINGVTTTDGKPVATYNLNGQRVDNNSNAKGVFIVKNSDGTTTKVIKK